MDLRNLRYFLAVAEELHFTRAAARLNMSQPPLSQAINRLEQELGFKLLERSKREVSLTEAGRVLLLEGHAIFARVDDAVRHARRASRGELGYLKVGFVPWAEFTSVFLDAFKKFGEHFPEVNVDFHSMPRALAVVELIEGRLDLAFLSTPPDPPRGMNHIEVLRDTLYAALPAAHPLAKQRVVSIKSLAKEPLIAVARERTGSFYSLVDMLFHNQGLDPRPRHVIDHPQTALAVVAAGAGVSLVAGSYKNVKHPGVTLRPVRPTARITMIAAWRPGEKSPVLQAFLKTLEGFKL